MGITVEYRSDPRFRERVANAIAADPKARAVVLTTAQSVASSAKTNVLTGTGDNQAMRQGVADRIRVKRVKTFRRKRREPVRSRIPVALVASDSMFSADVEWGHGPRVPGIRFLSNAARSVSRASGAVRYIRRRG
jgi:hypothetical protein